MDVECAALLRNTQVVNLDAAASANVSLTRAISLRSPLLVAFYQHGGDEAADGRSQQALDLCAGADGPWPSAGTRASQPRQWPAAADGYFCRQPYPSLSAKVKRPNVWYRRPLQGVASDAKCGGTP